jgi:hypothetical protein
MNTHFGNFSYSLLKFSVRRFVQTQLVFKVAYPLKAGYIPGSSLNKRRV